jgi:hypothetical protein
MLDTQCPTGKSCFQSYRDAERTIVHIKKKGDVKNAGVPKRPYKCETCRWFHITSWSARDKWWD